MDTRSFLCKHKKNVLYFESDIIRFINQSKCRNFKKSVLTVFSPMCQFQDLSHIEMMNITLRTNND